MKRIVILSGSPRKNGNTNLLCRQFQRGAEEAGHSVRFIPLAEKRIGFCRACDACMHNGGVCMQKDDMTDILCAFQQADVVVLDSNDFHVKQTVIAGELVYDELAK